MAKCQFAAAASSTSVGVLHSITTIAAGSTRSVTGNAECIVTHSGQCSGPLGCEASAGATAFTLLSGSTAP